MNTEDSVETSLGQLLQSAQTIAQGVGTEPVGSTSRNQAISELGNVLQQMVSLANTQVGDDYIFGGTNSGTPPVQSTGGNASTVLGTSLTTGNIATASSTATAATGVYQLTSDGAGDVTLTNTSDPSATQTVTGVTNGTASINFGTLGVTVTAGSNFTVAGLNGQTIAVGSGVAYGGNTTRPQVTVGVGDTIQTNHTGDQVFGNSIAALQATIAAVEGGTQGDVSNAANQLSTTQTQVLAIQSDGGVTLQQVSSIGTQQTAQQSALQTQQSNLDAVSQDQIAVQLLQVQNALEASFEITGRISSLNLTNYLPSTGA